MLTQKISKQVNDETTLKKQADILDVGVLMYLLLNDVTGGEDHELMTVLSGGVSKETVLEGPQWQNVSRECKELIQLMVVPDPRQRLSIAQVLAHPWFQFV